MSLDIVVADRSSHVPVASEPPLQLDDDARYWFLHPLFERLRSQTGQYIDLYGDAEFTGADLGALERTLQEARRLVESQPELGTAQAGTKRPKKKREQPPPVDRKVMLALLDQWDVIVKRARQLGCPVVCIGD
jgi:hypothetical protein